MTNTVLSNFLDLDIPAYLDRKNASCAASQQPVSEKTALRKLAEQAAATHEITKVPTGQTSMTKTTSHTPAPKAKSAKAAPLPATKSVAKRESAINKEGTAKKAKKAKKAVASSTPAAKAKPAPSQAPKATLSPAKPAGKRAAVEAAAREGKLPQAPDFSADTHKRFRSKLASVVDLAKAGDLKGLRKFEINPVSTSPKAIARYRDLCVTALEARAAR